MVLDLLLKFDETRLLWIKYINCLLGICRQGEGFGPEVYPLGRTTITYNNYVILIDTTKFKYRLYDYLYIWVIFYSYKLCMEIGHSIEWWDFPYSRFLHADGICMFRVMSKTRVAQDLVLLLRLICRTRPRKWSHTRPESVICLNSFLMNERGNKQIIFLSSRIREQKPSEY